MGTAFSAAFGLHGHATCSLSQWQSFSSERSLLHTLPVAVCEKGEKAFLPPIANDPVILGKRFSRHLLLEISNLLGKSSCSYMAWSQLAI